jgi:amino-acid N-acetyltransferase
MAMTSAPTIRRMRAADDAAVKALLIDSHLPIQDLESAADLQCWVIEESDRVIGVVGLQGAGDAVLLRSLAILPARRGQGWGRMLVATAEDAARAAGVRQLVLLTETAHAFFAALGYGVIERYRAPETVRLTESFRSLCPVAAVCMKRSLET